MTARMREQAGSAMVIAMMSMLIMLALGLGVFTFVEGQQRASANERIRESSYNLAEAALESTVAYLSVGSEFPAASTDPWGETAAAPGQGAACGPSSVATDRCPNPATVTGAFSQGGDAAQPDHRNAPQWSTTVWDDVGASANLYQEGVTNAPGNPMWDTDSDGEMWIRSQATVAGRSKVLVAKVEKRGATTTASPYPGAGLQATDLFIEPANTTSLVADMQGTATVPGRIDLYCAEILYPSHGQGWCPGANATLGQVYPWTISTGQPGNVCIGEDGTPWPYGGQYYPKCWSPDVGADVVALRARAQANGTYYATSCPASLTGEVVFIDYINGGTACRYLAGSSTWNSSANPGMVVLGHNSGLQIGGNNTYYGLIYNGNTHPLTSGSRGSVSIEGTARVQGAVIVEGGSLDLGGGLMISSTRSPAFIYDPGVFADFDEATTTSSSSGGYRISPGTFREIPVNGT